MLLQFSRKVRLLILISCWTGFSSLGAAQTKNLPSGDTTSLHEVTLFLMPTMHPLDWTSPASLYESVARCFYKNSGLEDHYLLGHATLRLKTPLLPAEKHVAMTAANKQQEVDLVLRQKIGVGILGATLEGKIEEEDHIRHMLTVYVNRRKVSFITFRVSEKAMERMLRFVTRFSEYNLQGHRPSDYYGGAYWPLFEGEGAGCTAFSLGVLTSGGVLPVDAEAWKIKVNIPMELIGGEYHQNKRISFRKILKTKTWHDGRGEPNTDFVKHQVYDPSIAYEWVLKRRQNPDSAYVPVEENGLSGLLVDARNQPVPGEEVPIFVPRPETDLFIESFKKKINP